MAKTKTEKTPEEIKWFNDAWGLDELGKLHGYKSEIYLKELEKFNSKYSKEDSNE